MGSGRDLPGDGVDADLAEAISEIDEETLAARVRGNDPRKIAIRLVFSFGFLALLIWKLPGVSPADLVPEPTAAAFAWVTAAIALHTLAFSLQTLRWAEVSDTLAIHLRFRRLFSHLLAGEFVSNALPTSFGGDIVRVIRQGNDAGDYADAFASVSLERLTGWLVLPLLSFTGLALSAEYRSLGTESLVVVIVGGTAVLALSTILVLAGHPRGAGRLVGDKGWRRYLAAVHLGVVAFRHRPGQAVKVLVAGIAFQLMQVLTVVACARALGISQIGFLAALTFFPPTAILQNLPLALGGLGIREAAFVYFFSAIGVSNADAIALGLLVYVVFVVSSLAGAPSFLRGGFSGQTVSLRAEGR